LHGAGEKRRRKREGVNAAVAAAAAVYVCENGRGRATVDFLGV